MKIIDIAIATIGHTVTLAAWIAGASMLALIGYILLLSATVG